MSGSEALVHDAVAALSDAFAARDVDAVLACFAPGEVLYAGSEAGEWAIGRPALAALLDEVLGRDEAYAFAPVMPRGVRRGGLLHVLCDATGTATGRSGESETFAYRLTGVLEQHGERWLWRSLSGSEPTPIG